MKLSLAPIQGMTVSFYRNAFHHIFGGIDTYYSPFITTSGPAKMSPKLFKDLLPEANDSGLRVVPQLLSNKGEDFNLYANHLVSMGYKEVNWNIGCPYPTVTKKKRGSGILAHHDLVDQFLDSVCKADNYQVSVKMRLGYDNTDQGLDIIKRLNQYPVKEVAIHGRLGIQKYEGSSDIDAYNVLAEMVDHPLIYNGDIFTVDDYKRISNKAFNTDQFMLARGLLKDPFLASEIRGKTYSPQEKRNKIEAFHQIIYDHYQTILSGDRHLLDRMKEFWLYLSHTIDSHGHHYKAIKKTKTKTNYEAAVKALLRG